MQSQPPSSPARTGEAARPYRIKSVSTAVRLSGVSAHVSTITDSMMQKIAARVGRAESTLRLWTSTAWTITAAPSTRILNDLRSEARRLERLSAEGRPDGNTAAIIEAREFLAQAETVMASALARAKAILDAAVPPSRQDEKADRTEVAA